MKARRLFALALASTPCGPAAAHAALVSFQVEATIRVIEAFGGADVSAAFRQTLLSVGISEGAQVTGTLTYDTFVYAEITRVRVVPVPAALWLFASGVIGLLCLGSTRADLR